MCGGAARFRGHRLNTATVRTATRRPPRYATAFALPGLRGVSTTLALPAPSVRSRRPAKRIAVPGAADTRPLRTKAVLNRNRTRRPTVARAGVTESRTRGCVRTGRGGEAGAPERAGLSSYHSTRKSVRSPCTQRMRSPARTCVRVTGPLQNHLGPTGLIAASSCSAGSTHAVAPHSQSRCFAPAPAGHARAAASARKTSASGRR